jgi:hypothetical protein
MPRGLHTQEYFMRVLVKRTAAAALLIAGATALACVKYVASPGPDASRARPFDEQKVHGTMGEIAIRVHAIEVILRQGPPGPESKAEVERLLAELENAANALSAESLRASHPALAANSETFLADIRMARRAVAADPPNYFLAGSISGACAACHGAEAGSVRGRSVR